MTTKLIVPIVHPNGTPKSWLLEQREVAYAAIENAAAMLRAMAPNGRDYYPEPGRMDAAVEQHTRRQKVLGELLSEIEDECVAISNQTS